MKELIIFFTVTGIIHVLAEIPHVWANNWSYDLRFRWMRNSKWMTDSSPRENRTYLNVIFADSYHTFANFIKLIAASYVIASTLISFYHPIIFHLKMDFTNYYLGLTPLFWPLSRWLTFKLLIVKIKKVVGNKEGKK